VERNSVINVVVFINSVHVLSKEILNLEDREVLKKRLQSSTEDYKKDYQKKANKFRLKYKLKRKVKND
jgi:hypothetical protein